MQTIFLSFYLSFFACLFVCLFVPFVKKYELNTVTKNAHYSLRIETFPFVCLFYCLVPCPKNSLNKYPIFVGKSYPHDDLD